MNLFLPKQHGAWAMLVVPFLLGVVYGGFHWLQIFLGCAWLCLYLATYPLIMALKKKRVSFHIMWFKRYFFIAVLFAIPVIIYKPLIIIIGLGMTPFFLLNVYFSKQNMDRSFRNDLSAIMAFSMSTFATYYLGSGTLTYEAVLLWILSVLFFTGSTFYVKMMIREKKNPAFRWIAWFYHILIVALPLFFGMWIVAVSYVPSLIRVVVSYGKNLTPMHTGIIEIINSCLFFIAIVWSSV